MHLAGKAFITLILLIFPVSGYCLNLDRIKAAYLNGEYRIAISEGEKILLTSVNHSGFDELYYYLGLSYLKDNNLVRSKDMFERVASDYKNSRFLPDSRLALGDVYFIQGDFAKAENCYAELLDTKLKPAVLFRLSEIYQKKGDDAKSKEYLAKLKDEYPASLEAKVNKGLSVMLQRPPAEESSVSEERSSFEEAAGTKVYSVQVGFFSSKENALNFKEELAKKDFPAYVEEVEAEGKLSYRVKVGKLGSLREALELQKQLSQAGYPTKVCP